MEQPFFQSRTRPQRYRSPSRSGRKTSVLVSTVIFLSLLLCGWIWGILLTKGQLTIAGVPSHIMINFLLDEKARNAYFQGDSKKLHDRLKDMGIKEKIKAHYRPQIRDEVKLDQYIHQLMYERTGYVGEHYQLNSKGVLVLKPEHKKAGGKPHKSN